MRGLPGSGKSYKAKQLLHLHQNQGKTVLILSTDDYFINRNTQVYEFNSNLLGIAHQWNLQRAKTAIENKVEVIIIDNTNTQSWEAKPYATIALQHGTYSIDVQEPDSEWWKERDLRKMLLLNTHQVSLETLERMMERWEDIYLFKRSIQKIP